MTSEERLQIVLDGVRALHQVNRRLRAQLPPPEHPDVALLRALRDIGNLLEPLERAVEDWGTDSDAVYFRDAILSMEADASALKAIIESPRLDASESPYRVDDAGRDAPDAALSALYDLLVRYETGEFMPPHSWFGRRTPDA